MDGGEGRREKHLKRSYGQMDWLLAVALNGSMKAEKMTICHLKPRGVPLVLEKAISSVCRLWAHSDWAPTVHTFTHTFHK